LWVAQIRKKPTVRRLGHAGAIFYGHSIAQIEY
jgi:hypothetical protein